jgi:GDP-D-mannose dehydratase
MKKALVTGISGQDGAYLARLLLEKGYQVWGTSRDAQISSFRNLERLSIRNDVQLASVALNDFRSVIQVLFKAQPELRKVFTSVRSICLRQSGSQGKKSSSITRVRASVLET